MPPSPPPPPLLHLASDPDTGHSPPPPLASEAEHTGLHAAELLSREEVLRRRSRRMKLLARHYREHYWALMKEVRAKLRDYYRSFGVSPLNVDSLESEAAATDALVEGSGENDGGGIVKKNSCGFSGCNSAAMPLTRYCYPHILCDSRQTLYKPCTFETCSGHTCGKPVLRAATPSFCKIHIQKIQKHLSQVISRAGLKLYASGSPAPSFHVIVAEYVHQIQIRRRKSMNANGIKQAIIKIENSG